MKQKDLQNQPVMEKKLEMGSRAFYPVHDKASFQDIIHKTREYGRDKFYALTSGGKDSITTTDMLDEMGVLSGVLHIDTGVGLSMTQDFLRDYCQSRGWKLEIITPPFPHIYASFVLKYGFPGPGLHNITMAYLKYQAMRKWMKSRHDRNKSVFVSGVRKYESQRRMGNYPTPIYHDGPMWFTSPIFYMTDKMVYEQYIKRGLKRSPAYDNGLTTSGECMCGAFARREEMALIRKLDKKLTSYIEWLELGVKQFGTPLAKKNTKWGGYGLTDAESQQVLTAFMADQNLTQDDVNAMEVLSCGNECGPGTLRGETDF